MMITALTVSACSSKIKLSDINSIRKSYSYEYGSSETTCISNMIKHCNNSDINILESATIKKKTMNTKQIERFIMFYERITKNMKKNYTKNDIIIFLDKKHKIKSVSY